MNTIFSVFKAYLRRYYIIKACVNFTLFIIMFILIMGLGLFFESLFYMAVPVKIVIIIAALSSFTFFFYSIKNILKFITVDFLPHNILDEELNKVHPDLSFYFKDVFQIKEELLKKSHLMDILQHVLLQKEKKILSLSNFIFSPLIKLAGRLFIVAVILLLSTFLGFSLFRDKAFSSLNRLLAYDKEFFKPFPVKIFLKDSHLVVPFGRDFHLTIYTSEDYDLPLMNIYFDGEFFPMNKKNNNTYAFSFRKVEKDIFFSVGWGKYRSEVFHLKVFSPPRIKAVEMKLAYPPYTGKKDELIFGQSNLNVPEGTLISFKVLGENVNSAYTYISDTHIVKLEGDGEEFIFKERILRDCEITFKGYGHYGYFAQFPVKINVIKDIQPTIVSFFSYDSLNNKLFAKNIISDDYGFSKLEKVIRYYEDDTSWIIRKPVPISFWKSFQEVYDTTDISTFNLKPGTSMAIHYVIYDNNSVWGASKAEGSPFVIYIPNKDEIAQMSSQEISQATAMFSKASQASKEIVKEISKMLERNVTTFSKWENKSLLNSILENFNSIQAKITSSQDKLSKIIQQMQNLNVIDSNLLKKYDKINEILKETFLDEIKQLISKLQEAIEKDQTQNLIEHLKKIMELSNFLNREMERTQSLLKELEFELKVKNTIATLDKLANETKNIAEKVEQSKEFPYEEMQNLIQNIQDASQSLNDIKKISQELGYDMDVDPLVKELNAISEELSNIKEPKSNQQKKEISHEIKQKSKKIEDVKNTLAEMFNNLRQEENALELEALRKILQKSINLSNYVEEFYKISTENVGNTSISTLLSSHTTIENTFKNLKDSIYMLSTKMEELGPKVNRITRNISNAIQETANLIKERNFYRISMNSRTTLMHINELNNLLSDVYSDALNSQDQTHNCQGANCSKCLKVKKNKKGNKPSLNSLIQMYQELKNAIEKSFNKQGSGEFSLTPEMIEIISKHNYIKTLLEEMLKEQNQGKEPLNEAISKMKEAEKQLLDKKLDKSLLQKYEEINVKLWEALNAEKTQEFDNNRISRPGQNISQKPNYIGINPPNNFSTKEWEWRYAPIQLTPFYKRYVENYQKALLQNK